MGRITMKLLAAIFASVYVLSGISIDHQHDDRALFDPYHRRDVELTDAFGSIHLAVKEQRLFLDIKQFEGSSGRLALPQEMIQVNEIKRISKAKVAVIGMFNGDLWEVALIDILRFRIEDRFFCYEPAISPVGPLIAFVKFFPTHADSAVSFHYMLYNAIKGATGNRASGISENDLKNVGLAIWPPHTGNKPFDNLRIASSEVHTIASNGFFWNAKGDLVIFADEYRGKIALVLAKIKHQIIYIHQSDVAQTQLCPKAETGMSALCKVRLVHANFNEVEGKVSLEFEVVSKASLLHKKLSLPYSDFRIAEKNKL